MRPELSIPVKKLPINAGPEDWMEKLAKFLARLSDLLGDKVKDEELIDYGEDLVAARSTLAMYTYLVRRERDKALAKGYERYPRGEYNADAASALARQFASEEIRLRELCKEMQQALDMRFELNRSAISTARVALQYG